VIEVLSPTGRDRDLSEKRRIYAEGGAAWYWLVDPVVPSVTILRLAGRTYEEHALVEGSTVHVTDLHDIASTVAADYTERFRSYSGRNEPGRKPTTPSPQPYGLGRWSNWTSMGGENQ